MSVINDLADVVRGSGEALVYLNSAPDDPDELVTLYEYAGLPPVAVMEDAISRERPAVQVVYRGKTYPDTRARAQAGWLVLARIRNADLGAARYVKIEAQNQPHQIGPDERGRHLLAFNLYVDKTP